MHASLARLAALPADTRVYCGHEYTLANLAFARAVEPDNDTILAFERRARRLRAANQPTIPSTISDERSINPFLRTSQPAIRRAAGATEPLKSDTDAAVFATLRRWKDGFKG
jgi:hydroxyacylglutathione hydrolase